MKILVMPNDLSDIDKYKNIDGFIIGINGYSWYTQMDESIDTLTQLIPKIKNSNKEIFISLNKLMYNQDIPLLKEYLLRLDKLGIDGIMYEDVAVINLAKELDLKTSLIWFGVHSFTSYHTANYWYGKGVSGGVLSTEIPLDHIKVIRENTKLPLMMYGYGYLPMFVSARPLLSSYFNYIDKPKDDKSYHMYEKERNMSYPTYEAPTGTVILSSEILNTINELPEINNYVDYIILSSLNIPSENFDKICKHYAEALNNLDSKEELKRINLDVNNNSPTKTDKGFLYKETIYRVKNDGE